MSNKAITQLKAELAKREKYWQEWNGRAANQIARIEYENEQLQEQVDRVKLLPEKWRNQTDGYSNVPLARKQCADDLEAAIKGESDG